MTEVTQEKKAAAPAREEVLQMAERLDFGSSDLPWPTERQLRRDAAEMLRDVAATALAEPEYVLKVERNGRGFAFVPFKDRYGVECSLQESSLAEEACVWFGCDEANPQVMKPGKGWVSVPFPPDTLFHTRMHLTQEQAAALIPYLQRFVRTGLLHHG